jgi:hypothetical protein
MQGKAPLSPPSGSSSSPDGQVRSGGKLDEMWGALDSVEKPKQVEAQAGLTRVPIDGIKELDRSQQLLSAMIKLATAVSSVRLKAERASVNAAHLAPVDSSGGDVGQWYDLIQQVEEIAALEAAASQPDAFPEQAKESIDRFHEARMRASETAGEIATQLAASGNQIPITRKHEMSLAIAKVRIALEQCASACDSESQQSLRRIEHRVQTILERIEGEQEPSTKPTGEKQPHVVQEKELESSLAMDDRKLAESGETDHLKQPKER